LFVVLTTLAGAGCDGVLNGTASTVPSAPCSGAYTDAEFGVNYDPPAGLSGPNTADEEESLRLVVWQSVLPIGQSIAAALTYPIAPLEVDLEEAVDAAIETQRATITDELGHTLLTDEAVVLDSGNDAHVLSGGSEDGATASVFVVAEGTDRFAIAFLVGSASAVETMLVSGLSLCVE